MKKTFLVLIAATMLFARCSDDDNNGLDSLLIEPQTAEMMVGDQLLLKVKISPENYKLEGIVWTSSNINIATVTPQGNVTALKTGNVSVSAQLANKTAICNITISRKMKTPLSQFAEYDLVELNKFASGNKNEAFGNHFQWGRNICFVYDKAGYTLEDKAKSNGNDELVTDHNVFIGNWDGEWMTDGLKTDTWTSVVNKVKNNPVYIGENGGDPCPKGYHLPTKAEFIGIFGTDKTNVCFDKTNIVKNVKETIKVNGTTADYQADYLCPGGKICYGLKFKNADNTLLSAYRWEIGTKKEIIVTARLLGKESKDATIEQIANEDFWKNNNENDEMRIFPASGARSALDGKVNGREVDTNYWTSEADDFSGAFYVTCGEAIKGEYYARVTDFGMRSSAFSIRCIANK